jgi:hypothetical protein
MLVGPQRVLMMDEISTGLDSATLHSVVQFLSALTHGLQLTTVVSLLQVRRGPSRGRRFNCTGLPLHWAAAAVDPLALDPSPGLPASQPGLWPQTARTPSCAAPAAHHTCDPPPPLPLLAALQPPPEVFLMFDDLMLMAEGNILYHGPIGEAKDFFDSLGFVYAPAARCALPAAASCLLDCAAPCDLCRSCGCCLCHLTRPRPGPHALPHALPDTLPHTLLHTLPLTLRPNQPPFCPAAAPSARTCSATCWS